MQDFRLLMLSAMYENGGNTTHRFLDGHPQMFVYPFESQLGTNMVQDHLSSMFPVKYRWPAFKLDATPREDYRLIIDEECKVRACTPHVSKFRHVPFDFNDDERCAIFEKYIHKTGRSRTNNVVAFFKATFDAWKDYKRTDKQEVYVGYSPIIVVDADKILEDLPQAHILHVVRNPYSAYADTKKRPVPLSLRRFMTAWITTQYHALVFNHLYPNRIHIVRYEDVIRDPQETLGQVCEKLGISSSESLKKTTWNGTLLKETYPWGTIRQVTPDINKATAQELSDDERNTVRKWAHQYLEIFGYKDFV